MVIFRVRSNPNHHYDLRLICHLNDQPVVVASNIKKSLGSSAENPPICNGFLCRWVSSILPSAPPLAMLGYDFALAAAVSQIRPACPFPLKSWQ